MWELNVLRGRCGMKKAYLRGLTQRQERQEGVDFFAQLSPTARIFAFQFKAPKGQNDQIPYRFTLVGKQHDKLHALALQASPPAVFYVLPFYASHKKLQCHVPNLIQDTWLLPIAPMVPSQVFGTNKTKVVHCYPGIAVVNPEYQLQRVPDRHCQVDEELVDRPSRYWAPARREPAMLGIKNGRQLQLDNASAPPDGRLGGVSQWAAAGGTNRRVRRNSAPRLGARRETPGRTSVSRASPTQVRGQSNETAEMVSFEGRR